MRCNSLVFGSVFSLLLTPDSGAGAGAVLLGAPPAPAGDSGLGSAGGAGALLGASGLRLTVSRASVPEDSAESTPAEHRAGVAPVGGVLALHFPVPAGISAAQLEWTRGVVSKLLCAAGVPLTDPRMGEGRKALDGVRAMVKSVIGLMALAQSAPAVLVSVRAFLPLIAGAVHRAGDAPSANGGKSAGATMAQTITDALVSSPDPSLGAEWAALLIPPAQGDALPESDCGGPSVAALRTVVSGIPRFVSGRGDWTRNARPVTLGAGTAPGATAPAPGAPGAPAPEGEDPRQADPMGDHDDGAGDDGTGV